MPSAPDDIVFEHRVSATRRGAAVLMGLLLVLVAGIAASIVYNDVRLDRQQRRNAIAATQGGDPDRGLALIRHYGCAACHAIAGVDGTGGNAGPDLTGIGKRLYVGGVLTNTPDNLSAFIVNPQAVDDKSAMPRTGITSAEARDVAAYLYALR